MKVYINVVFGAGKAYLEARLENGMRLPFRSLTTWDKKAQRAIKEHLDSVYGYKDIKFIT